MSSLDDLDAAFASQPAQTAPASSVDELDQAFSGNGTSSQDDSPAHKFYNELARQTGLTGRMLTQGVGNIIAVPADIVNGAVNLEGNLVAKIPLPFSKNNIQAPKLNTNLAGDLSNKLTSMGFPQPQNSLERGMQDIGSNLTSAAATGGLSTEAPLFNALSIVSGTAASDTAKEIGASAPVQVAAGLAGGVIPSATNSSVNMLMNSLRGDSGTMSGNISAFNSLGASPSLGQATQNPLLQTIESGLAKTAGGANVMAKASAQQGQNIGQTVDQLASSLAQNPSAENAGRTISQGVNNTFIPQAKAVQQALYDKLDAFIPPTQMVPISNTSEAVNRMTKPIEGAEALSNTNLLSNPTLNTVKGALQADAGGSPAKLSSILDENGQPFITPAQEATNQLPYTAVKQLRTAIGNKLNDVDLSPDVPRAQLKQLYGALSQDMQGAAEQAGPQAQQAFNRANNYTSTLHDRIDTLQGVIGDKDPEKVFQSAMSGTSEGASTLRSVMRSLPDDGKQMMAATVLKRMGRANPSQQNDVGDVFSTDRFLTNWNKLSPEAKSALFGSQAPEFNQSMNNLASVASNLKSGSQVFQNSSGTAGASHIIDLAGELGSAGTAAAMGHYGPAAAVTAGIVSRNLLAQAMTNPENVNALANYRDLPSVFNKPDIQANVSNYKNMLMNMGGQ